MAKPTSQSPPDRSIEPTHDNLFKFTYHREDGVDDLSRELFEIVFDEATNNEFNWPTLNMDSSSVIDQAGREKFADLIFSVHTKEDNSSTQVHFFAGAQKRLGLQRADATAGLSDVAVFTRRQTMPGAADDHLQR